MYVRNKFSESRNHGHWTCTHTYGSEEKNMVLCIYQWNSNFHKDLESDSYLKYTLTKHASVLKWCNGLFACTYFKIKKKNSSVLIFFLFGLFLKMKTIENFVHFLFQKKPTKLRHTSTCTYKYLHTFYQSLLLLSK